MGILSHFSPIFLDHIPPQLTSRVLCPLFPHPPPPHFPPFPPHFPHFPASFSISPIFPIFPDSQIMVW